MARKLLLTILLIIIIFTLCGCTNIFKADTPSLEEKVDEELRYIDSEVISMLNSFNGIIYTNYKVIPSEIKQTNTASNPNNQMNESGSTTSSEQKESQETSSESTSSSSKSQGNTQEKKSEVNTLKMEPNTILDNKHNINWNKIKSNIEILYSSWITIKLDLEKLGVQTELLNEFSDELDKSMISIKKEDTTAAIENLTNLYDILSQFVVMCSNDNYKISIYKTKKSVLYTYKCINDEKWDEAGLKIKEAENTFKEIKDTNNTEDNRRINIQRSNILIKELDKCLQLKDKEVALVKYKALIQELTIL